MKKIYLIPNIITAFGLTCGLFVILKVNLVDMGESTFSMMLFSSLLILSAALADLFDGAIARALNAQSEFGVMFDSLSDSISFGVAPSVLLLKNTNLPSEDPLLLFVILGAILYCLCGILRLARFNVAAHEQTQQKLESHAQPFSKHFTGLPIPAAALAAISSMLFLASPFWSRWGVEISAKNHAILLGSLMIILGFFMISRWKFPSAKMLDFRLPSFQLLFLAGLLSILLFYGILYCFPLLLLLSSWTYVGLGWSLSIARLIAGKKSSTLADFEPDEES